MRRRLMSVVTAALVGVAVSTAGAVSPAHAGAGSQAIPQGCYFSYLAVAGTIVGGYTDCLRDMGLHRAVAKCADGSTVYGFWEEMDYGRQSIATCGDWLFGYRPAVAAWGEFHLDY